MEIKDYYIIHKDRFGKVLKMSGPYFTFRDAIRQMSFMYSDFERIIKVYEQNFIYLNEKGEEIEVRILYNLPEYVCGLRSDDPKIMEQLMQMRRGWI